MDGIFGIGPLELFFIAIIALIVLGPERLPSALREVAGFIRKLRELAGEFTSQFSEELKALDEINPRKIISSMTDPTKPLPGDKPVSPASKATNEKLAAATANAQATSKAATEAANAAVRAKAAKSIRPPVKKDAATTADAPLAEGMQDAATGDDAPVNSILPPDKQADVRKADKITSAPQPVTAGAHAAKNALNGNGANHNSSATENDDTAGDSASSNSTSDSDASGSDT